MAEGDGGREVSTNHKIFTYENVCHLLAREAWYLDEKRWADWLDLYTPDASYFVPAWLSENTLSTDPNTELSLIHIDSRLGLEERVFRIESRDSFASIPLDRTTHHTSNVAIMDVHEESCEVTAAWLVHCVGSRIDISRGGRYYYVLRNVNGELKIAAKRTVMIDEKIEGTVDFYHL